ncbi:hypothetical protein Y1Q_0007158 [Alligator mississippiensis]|uniref:Uncharacterized protein n=1 Tax=Alligator mississippiensis TaxID=8496 RepID=A0A151N5T2_ALLMI|nr:hypothetical protein Y1Q_0007158 [Alligator mississippiensis]
MLGNEHKAEMRKGAAKGNPNRESHREVTRAWRSGPFRESSYAATLGSAWPGDWKPKRERTRTFDDQLCS